MTVRWAAHDDDGDDLIYSLYLRGDGETVWRLLKDKITDKAYSFDATLIPDGGYRIKVVASDAPSHTPGDALTGEKVSDRFEVDTTPPVITNLKAAAEQAKLRRGRLHEAVARQLSTPKMLLRRLPTPSTRWTRGRGSMSIRWASSPTRSTSTTNFTHSWLRSRWTRPASI